MAVANNPFDLNKTSGAELLGSALTGIAAPQATGYNAATAGATGYNAVNALPSGFDASTMTSEGYDAAQAKGTNWNVEGNQTVQGQLAGIIASNSPLLQQARANSLAQMNQRGLVNSSMAVGAGEDAVIRQALPIAQQDATLYGNRAQFNANSANQLGQFNAGQLNAGYGFTASAANQAAAQNQAALNNAGQYNATALNQASLANQGAANQAAQFTAGSSNQAAAANANAQNQAAQFTAGLQTDVSKTYATALNSTVQNMMDQSMKYALSNADAQTKIELQNIDASTRADLARTEAQYKTQMQASASTNEIFQQVSKNIADTMANPDLSAYATTDGNAPAADKSNMPAGTAISDSGTVDAKGQKVGAGQICRVDAEGRVLEVLQSPKQIAVNAQKSYLQNSLAILTATSGITVKKADGTTGTLADLLTFT